MKNAIILHGAPDKKEYYHPQAPSMSNAHWIPWLQAQLLKKDIAAATPEVPRSFERHYSTWEKEVRRFEISPETILVGHSTGCGIFVKYLSKNREIKVGKVVLVAPFLDPDKKHPKEFLNDFEIDPNLMSRTTGITIFNSDNDADDIHKSVEILRSKIKNIKYKEFHHYGHFMYENMYTMQFPEPLEELLSSKIL